MAEASEHAVHLRVRAGLRRPHNWVQLFKFCAVGGSGYVVNLCVFTLAVHALDLHHLVGATMAFAVAVMNNFFWNRHWTFRARSGHAGFQAARFFTVSVIAFLFAAVVLELLVRARRPGGAGSGDLDRGGHAAELHREQDVELLPQRAPRLTAAVAALASAALLALPAAAAARPPLELPESQTEPPRLFRLSAQEAERIADRASKVRGSAAPTRASTHRLHARPRPLAGQLLRRRP